MRHPDRWIKISNENEPSESPRELPDGFNDPQSPFHRQSATEDEYRAQLDDAAAVHRRELMIERQIGAGPVLRTYPTRIPEHAQGLMSSYQRAAFLDPTLPHDRALLDHLLVLDDIEAAWEDHAARLRTDAALEARRRGSTCEACGIVQPTSVQTIAIDGEQYRLCESCSKVGLADAVERRAAETLHGLDVTRRDAVSRLRGQRSHQQNGA